MNQKTFTAVAVVIFLLIAVLHGLRLIYGWEAEIGGLVMPLWLSGAALVIAAALAYQGFRLIRQS